MENRVNQRGFTEAQVQQQGSDIINVSVPGQGAQQVVNLVGPTAQLRFRQVLLRAPNTGPRPPAPTPARRPSPAPRPALAQAPRRPGVAEASAQAGGRTRAAAPADRRRSWPAASGPARRPARRRRPAARLAGQPPPRRRRQPGLVHDGWRARATPAWSAPRSRPSSTSSTAPTRTGSRQVGYNHRASGTTRASRPCPADLIGRTLYKFALDKATVVGKDIDLGQRSPRQRPARPGRSTSTSSGDRDQAVRRPDLADVSASTRGSHLAAELAARSCWTARSCPPPTSRRADHRRPGPDHRQLQPGPRPPTWPTC